jgi:hypothetical protein
MFLQRVPLAVDPQDVEIRVQHLASIDRTLAASVARWWDHRFDDHPFGIGQITRLTKAAAVCRASMSSGPHGALLRESGAQQSHPIHSIQELSGSELKSGPTCCPIRLSYETADVAFAMRQRARSLSAGTGERGKARRPVLFSGRVRRIARRGLSPLVAGGDFGVSGGFGCPRGADGANQISCHIVINAARKRTISFAGCFASR